MEKTKEKLPVINITEEKQTIIKEGNVRQLLQGLSIKLSEFAKSYEIKSKDRLDEYYRMIELSYTAYGDDNDIMLECQTAAFKKCIMNSFKVKLAEFVIDLMDIIATLKINYNPDIVDKYREDEIKERETIYDAYMEYQDILCVALNNFKTDSNQLHSSTRLAEKINLLMKVIVKDCREKHGFNVLKLAEEVNRYRNNTEQKLY